MSEPTAIYELVFNDTSTVDETRTTHLASGACYWMSRNLPGSGKAALDSTVGGNNCEAIQFEFSGHGAGNYVTNFKYYIDNRNAVATDMTHMLRVSTTWVSPDTYTDANIYGYENDWSDAVFSVPDTTNVGTGDGYTETSDPTRTNFIYNAVVVEALKTSGTATWDNILLYQYT